MTMRTFRITATYLAPLLILLLGLLLSGISFFYVDNWERNKVRLEFNREMDNHLSSLRREIDLNIQILYSIKSLFQASDKVTHSEFRTFVTPELQRYSSIQALEWIPRVSQEKRKQYEQEAQKAGYKDFRIKDRVKQGVMVPSKVRDEYFPVYYVEPFKRNKTAHGFDLGSEPKRLATLEEAAISGKMLATAAVRLVQEKKKQLGFLVFIPLYEQESQPEEKRVEQLTGFILGVYRIEDILKTAFDHLSTGELDIFIQLYDETDPAKKELLYQQRTKPEAKSVTEFEYSYPLDIAGRKWKLIGYPTTSYSTSKVYWLSYGVLIIGVLFSILFSVYLRLRLSELKQTIDQNQTIVETVPNGIVCINDRGIIELFNPTAEEMFGYKADEVLGKNVKMLMPDPHHSAHDEYIQNYIRTGKSKILNTGREVTGKRKDGSTFPLYLAIGKMHSERHRKFVGITIDITEQKEKEKQIIEMKEKAEQANRLKSEFLNTISHELRTPLTVILGNLPLLTEEEDMPEAEEVAEIAQEMEYSGKHLLVLINDLLDFSKIEAGKMKLAPQQTSIPLLVENAIKTVETMLREKGVSLNKELEEGVELFIDPIRVKQVVLNLLSNAIKFTDEGTIKITANQQGEFVQLRIEDTGCGIRKEDQSVIFEAFRQVDGSSTRAAGGTGLGLAITKKLVELHHGTISVESIPGEGATFQILFPKSLKLEDYEYTEKLEEVKFVNKS